MKNTYKPILFSTLMVRALLDDLKTQTRRIVKDDRFQNPDDDDDDLEFLRLTVSQKINEGDILWVRENLYQNGELELNYYAYGEIINEELIPNTYGPYGGKYSCRVIPSIHMPKWACRIFLKVKKIRIERLNQISDEDAIAEGISREKYCLDENVTIYENYLAGKDFYSWSDYGWNYGKETHSAPVASYCSLWEDINGDGSWNKNPFVWVIEFEKIDKPNDFLL